MKSVHLLVEKGSEMCSGSEAGSYLRPIDSCITQLKAQGPSETCNESKEEEEVMIWGLGVGRGGRLTLRRPPGRPAVYDLGLGGLWFGVWGTVFWGFGFRVQGLGF